MSEPKFDSVEWHLARVQRLSKTPITVLKWSPGDTNGTRYQFTVGNSNSLSFVGTKQAKIFLEGMLFASLLATSVDQGD